MAIEYENRLKVLASMVNSEVHGDIESVCINKLVCDSHRVEKGDLFCCVSGTFADGHKFAAAAVEKGAAALLCERYLENISVPQIIVENTRKAMATMAACYYKNPSENMTMIGVTGTNGKTTTTFMLKAIAESAGKKVGLIGTIKTLVGDDEIVNERVTADGRKEKVTLTTPDSIELQRVLALMRDRGVDTVIMEVSSHALDQYRAYGIVFDVAEFTNLTQDHLDYHKTFENYLAAKKKLFYSCIRAVINSDDAYAARLCENITCPITTFGLSGSSDVVAKNVKLSAKNVHFDYQMGRETFEITAPVIGKFNVYNALGAATVAMELGYTAEQIKQGFLHMEQVSGRMESLDTHDLGYYVILDYAHTPDALENAIKTIREFATGRVITVCGCGGDRDGGKRPIMGEIAAQLSDLYIVTSDNPRTEEPMEIIKMILEGVRKTGRKHVVIENRRAAIEYALRNAEKGDCILLAGKGHETYQEINGVKHDFDEKRIVAEIIETEK